MKALIQRVKKASVTIDEKLYSKIGFGLLVFLGVEKGDTRENADKLSAKLLGLRIFEDDAGKMNRSLVDVNGEMLIVSQFTLYSDCTNGNRPSFIEAAKPEQAKELYEYFCSECEKNNIKVEKGIFGADMQVSLVNDGPVTIVIEK